MADHLHDGRIKAYLCGDHFERLVNDKAGISPGTCETCPSRKENELAVKALSEVYQAEPHKMNQAVVTELKSIRRAMEMVNADLDGVRGVIHGNGRKGLVARLLILETRDETAGATSAKWFAIMAFAISTVIGMVSAVVAVIALWGMKS